MRYVTIDGGLYRLTDKSYQRLMESIHETGSSAIDDCGEYVGRVTNISSFGEAEALWELESLLIEQQHKTQKRKPA